MAVNLKNGRHLEFKWLTGFIKRAITKECVCQIVRLFPEMNNCDSYLLRYPDKILRSF